MCIFRRRIRDLIPILPGKYLPHTTWKDTLAAREEALQNRHMKALELWSEHTHKLPTLAVGDRIRLENQNGRRQTNGIEQVLSSKSNNLTST